MIKRLLALAGIGIGVTLVSAAAAYWLFDVRVVLDGSGSPRLAVLEPADAHAVAIARHRARFPAPPKEAGTGLPTVMAAGTGSEPVSGHPVTAGGATADPSAAPPPRAADAGIAAVPTTSDPGNETDGSAPASSRRGWPSFRGAQRDGIYRDGPVLTAWPDAGLRPAWKQPVGGGYASFAIARQRAFTIEQRGPQEVVAAYDVPTGRELWTHAWDADFREFMGGDGPRATPTWHDGRVYALGAVGELRCLDEETGRVLWRRNILDDNGTANLQWAMAASPLVVDDTVIVQPGGQGGRSVVAYDRRTGARAWSALDDKQAYVSPMLVTLAGRRQIVTVSASRMVGLAPDSGALLWEFPWVTQYDINAAQPLVVGDRRVFISSGYGEGAALIELMPNGDRLAVREIWRTNRMKNRFNSSVLYDGYIYGFDEAILACIDAATGELRWKGGRYGYGQLILADGHLIVLTEDGDLALVRATPVRHEEVARFPVLAGKTWNHPALADGWLLVRNLKEMAAFDLRGPPGTARSRQPEPGRIRP